jgi:EPS-associated MarR family transcriptional regulator
MPKITKSIDPDIHFRVLHALEENSQITQRELARKLGISLGGINYCLKALVEVGHIKMRNFQKNPNKASYFYLLTPQGVIKKSNLTGQFLQKKIKEYQLLKEEIESLGRKV